MKRFRLALEATLLTDLGISFHFLVVGVLISKTLVGQKPG